MLVSGKDDQVRPCDRMANLIEQRLNLHGFEKEFINLQYEDVGHVISQVHTGNEISGFYVGGNSDQYAFADIDSWGKSLKFICRHCKSQD